MIVYKLLFLCRVVQTNKKEKKWPTLGYNVCLLCCYAFQLFASGQLSWKHYTLPRLQLTNDRSARCHEVTPQVRTNIQDIETA